MTRPTNRRSVVALVALVIALLGPLTAPAHALPAPQPTTDHIGLYAQDWTPVTKNRTAANWELAARNHDLLVGNVTPYNAHISRLKSANPNLTVCVYDLGPYTVKGSALYEQLMREHPEYFARDPNGKLITVKAASASPDFPNNTLMDVGNPGWHAVSAQRIAEEIAAPSPDFDCAYMDSMGPGPFTGGTSGKPVKPGTNPKRVYTQTEWFQAERDMLNVIKARIGAGKYLFATGVVNGPNYTTSTHWLADSNVDGLQTDGWMRLGGAPPSAWPSFKIFQGNLDMVQNIHAKGKAFFAWVKLYNSSFTDATRKQWNDFTLASLLLVKESRQYFALTINQKGDRTVVPFPNEKADLGAALGPYTKTSACSLKPPTSACVFSRKFQRGNVSVNPVTHAASINVTG